MPKAAKKKQTENEPTEKDHVRLDYRPDKIIIGTDEAGRGPVLGPLVMAALAFKESDIQRLEWLGVKDSKMLSSEVRENLFERIREIVHDFRIEVIEPDAIDLSLEDASTNLNWLEADTTARLVGEMDADQIIIDCPSPNIPAYRNYLLKKLPKNVVEKAEVIVEHKADVNYIVVAAASVIAKVLRDRAIENTKREIGIDFGSGYMTDQKTKDFLEKYHDKYPELFRRKWQSYKNVEERKKQKTLGEY
ncbi:ribonuclease HII [Candidatus Woesearchaeota archaeon]|nr:ribonuclease HII [Candidatus Woesearchaeota archaeon]